VVSVIDVQARRVAAEAARRFVAGQISNIEFENRTPSSKDPAIWAIEDTLWCFYDDFEEHALRDKWEVPEETRKLMNRWVAFLYSQEEYLWPKISYPGVRPLEIGFWGRLFNRHIQQQEFMSVGDFNYWPFINKESFQNANSSPVLLSAT
jgi:hypothetical protein